MPENWSEGKLANSTGVEMRKYLITTLLALFLCDFGLAQEAGVSAQFVLAFGGHGEKPGQFQNPGGISVDPNGNVYVADTGNNRIQKFDEHGKLLTFIGGFGWESEQFQRPLDICADNGLDVFVADYENNRIERYDKDLNWISSITSNPSADDKLQFAFPNSVSISIHGDLFIVDSENERILKLNTLREPVLSFGDYDWGQGALSQPSQITVSRNDKVYVSDSDKGSVFVYDYYGNYLSQIGERVLQRPAGLALDQNNFLFVCDNGNDKVFVFNSAGALVLQIGSRGEKYGAFRNPSDVAIYRNTLYVADTDNHRVQVFSIKVQKAVE